MKRAVLLHGTDGTPQSGWLPWLKSELERRGYEVWVPELPNNHTPNRQAYNDFLFSNDWDFKDNLIVGHSSGAVSVLNLLEDSRCPHIKTAVLVGAWSDSKKAGLLDKEDFEKDQFNDLFPPKGFDFGTIKQKTDRLLFLHGDDDPYCPLDQAKWLAEQTASDIIVIPGGGHLNGGAGWTELPQLTSALEERSWL